MPNENRNSSGDSNSEISTVKASKPKKNSGKTVEIDLARTHKSLGLFPSALLLMGYGESKLENERVIKTEERNVKTGETVMRQLKMFSKSEKGLPRGKDPQVLIALLHLILRKQTVTNSVWFRKSDLFSVLGWQDTYENRQNVIEAIERYFDSAYEGLLLKHNSKKERRERNTSRIITDFKYIDERSTRFVTASFDSATDSDFEFNFSKVVFNTEFINEIRTAELSLHLNLKIIHKVQNSSIAVRLYEIINFLTTPKQLDFSINIIDLAHNRLGMSASKNAGQCWQKIAPAGEKLKKAEYLLSFEYDQLTRTISGSVNPQLVSPSTTNLEPLQKTDERRLALTELYIELGAYKNLAGKLINLLSEDQLEDAEIIATVIGHEKSEKSRGLKFGYGGLAVNHLKYLLENGEIDQKLFSNVSSLDAIFKDAKAEINGRSQSSVIDDQKEIALINNQPNHESSSLPSGVKLTAKTDSQINLQPSALSLFDQQISLPISIDDFEIVDLEAENLWHKCLESLRKNLPESVIETWFNDKIATPINSREQTLRLRITDQIAIDWIKHNYRKQLQTAVDAATKTKNKWQVDLKL